MGKALFSDGQDYSRKRKRKISSQEPLAPRSFESKVQGSLKRLEPTEEERRRMRQAQLARKNTNRTNEPRRDDNIPLVEEQDLQDGEVYHGEARFRPPRRKPGYYLRHTQKIERDEDLGTETGREQSDIPISRPNQMNVLPIRLNPSQRSPGVLQQGVNVVSSITADVSVSEDAIVDMDNKLRALKQAVLDLKNSAVSVVSRVQAEDNDALTHHAGEVVKILDGAVEPWVVVIEDHYIGLLDATVEGKSKKVLPKEQKKKKEKILPKEPGRPDYHTMIGPTEEPDEDLLSEPIEEEEENELESND